MNIACKKVSALIFSVIVATSVHGMEHENTVEVNVQKSAAVWYKKRSVQVAAALTVVAAGCALAVYMDKVAVPACIAKLFTAPTVQEEVGQAAQESFVEAVQNGQLPEGVAYQLQFNVHTFDAVKEKWQNVVKKASAEVISIWNECYTE
jgi:hypothetical protein